MVAVAVAVLLLTPFCCAFILPLVTINSVLVSILLSLLAVLLLLSPPVPGLPIEPFSCWRVVRSTTFIIPSSFQRLLKLFIQLAGACFYYFIATVFWEGNVSAPPQVGSFSFNGAEGSMIGTVPVFSFH